MKAFDKTEVALEILRSKCEEVEHPSEAEILVSLLENIAKDHPGEAFCLAAPEVNVRKKVAIIRAPDFSLDLINPKIVTQKEMIVSLKETCSSFAGQHYNCFRYNDIFVENGFKKEIIQLKGQAALYAQHAIDHLSGVLYHDRLIKFAVVRPNGKILNNDFCPCGVAKKRFEICCAKK